MNTQSHFRYPSRQVNCDALAYSCESIVNAYANSRAMRIWEWLCKLIEDMSKDAAPVASRHICEIRRGQILRHTHLHGSGLFRVVRVSRRLGAARLGSCNRHGVLHGPTYDYTLSELRAPKWWFHSHVSPIVRAVECWNYLSLPFRVAYLLLEALWKRFSRKQYVDGGYGPNGLDMVVAGGCLVVLAGMVLGVANWIWG